jgi:hypothetical protein
MRWIVAALVVALIVAALIYAGYQLPWVGFGDYTGSKDRFDRAKTLWDWMDLLLVPFLLALGAWLLNRSARSRERQAEERRIEEQQKVEEDRSREAALQTYLYRMTELIRDRLRESEPMDTKRSIARARTMTVLRQLDGLRNDLLLRFLHKAGLIGKEGSERHDSQTWDGTYQTLSIG